MFRRPTVFVIGAGAGFEIDMCLGNALMEEIEKDVNISFARGDSRGSGNELVMNALRNYARLTKTDANVVFAAGRSIAKGINYAGSIDNYIHNHRSNEQIKVAGKIAIVKVILDYEKRSKVYSDPLRHPRRFKDEPGVRQSWLHSFLRLAGDGIVVGKDLDSIFENVSVVTFNYDRCLEQFLWQGLQDRFALSAEKAAELVKKLDVFHAYGKIADLEWQGQGGLAFGGDPYGNEVDLYALSDSIRTYNEEVEASERILEIHKKITTAKNIIFLGFHFHEQNMELIRPKTKQKQAVQHAFATVLDRRAPERARIEVQIQALLHETAQTIAVNLEGVGCREMFNVWGTTLAS